MLGTKPNPDELLACVAESDGRSRSSRGKGEGGPPVMPLRPKAGMPPHPSEVTSESMSTVSDDYERVGDPVLKVEIDVPPKVGRTIGSLINDPESHEWLLILEKQLNRKKKPEYAELLINEDFHGLSG